VAIHLDFFSQLQKEGNSVVRRARHSFDAALQDIKQGRYFTREVFMFAVPVIVGLVLGLFVVSKLSGGQAKPATKRKPKQEEDNKKTKKSE
jgi:hypothetical protein